jgi:hypothetical protein
MNLNGREALFVMKLVPLLFGVALLVLVAAFGLHCLVMHCDHPKTKPAESKSRVR